MLKHAGGCEYEEILGLLSEEMGKAFEAAGYDPALGRVTPSNRPDLCEYQCNGAMAGAKQYRKAPIMIADGVQKSLRAARCLRRRRRLPPAS